MSDTKHTPGPWFTGQPISADGDDMSVVSIGPFDISNRPGRLHHYEDTICEVWDNQNNDGEVVANARLIAAAPDFKNARDSLFNAIAHGDDEHRAWLKDAIDRHFSVADDKAEGRS